MLKLTLNGQSVSLDVDPNMPLLYALRDIQQLTGTKFGCGAGLCGACTVHMNGEPIRSRQQALLLVARLNPGDQVEIVGWRDSQRFTAVLVAAERPELPVSSQ